MKTPNELIINSSYLRDRITELGIKQWWLAEQVGVDKKTVARWIQGKVRSIQPDNAKALAEVMACQVSDLCHSDQASQLATAEDQKNAALLLQTSSLLEKLGPIGEWNVIESLLRATIVPNLPLQVLGDLYNQLTVASWRQSKLEQAETFNKKALEIANKLGDKTILASALLSKANLLSWSGKLEDAIRTYNECLSHRDFIPIRTVGSIFSNLGAVLYETGDLDAALKFENQAIEQFQIHGSPMNLSIAYTNLVFIYLEMQEIELAEASNLHAEELARSDGYKRGLAMSKVNEAEILALKGQKQQAQETAMLGLDLFSQMGVHEGLNYRFAARVFRRTGDYAKANELLRKGFQAAEKFPVELAELYWEQAIVAEKTGDSATARSSVAKASDLFKSCGAFLRLKKLQSFFPDIISS